MCRGEGWQTEPWPLVRGQKTQDECFQVCKGRQGCTSFEIGPPKKKAGRSKCILYGHDDVQVANSFSLRHRRCFRIPGKMAIVVKKSKSGPVKAAIKSVIPTHIDTTEINDLGSGICRGPKWQKNNCYQCQVCQ